MGTDRSPAWVMVLLLACLTTVDCVASEGQGKTITCCHDESRDFCDEILGESLNNSCLLTRRDVVLFDDVANHPAAAPNSSLPQV